MKIEIKYYYVTQDGVTSEYIKGWMIAFNAKEKMVTIMDDDGGISFINASCVEIIDPEYVSNNEENK